MNLLTAMALTVAQLTTEALKLPEESRIVLAEIITESIHGKMDPAVEEAWEKEINRRVQEIRDGTAVLVDGDTVMREARAILNEGL